MRSSRWNGRSLSNWRLWHIIDLCIKNSFPFVSNNYEQTLKHCLYLWAVSTKIPICHLNSFILFHPGEYFHFGIVSGITRCLKQCQCLTEQSTLNFFVGIDRIVVAKSTPNEIWPILDYIKDFDNSVPFLIGLHHRKNLLFWTISLTANKVFL